MQFDLADDDQFIIMACDGLWDVRGRHEQWLYTARVTYRRTVDARAGN